VVGLLTSYEVEILFKNGINSISKYTWQFPLLLPGI